VKTILFYTIFLSHLIIGAQSKKIDDNIKKLENSQFTIIHGDGPAFKMKSSAAHKLIKIGKTAAEKLILALNDSTKVIMAHLVLCHIWFKHASFAGPKKIITDNGDMNIYYLGEEKGEGLLISETKFTSENYKVFIQAKDLERIKIYWKNKTAHP
jgi:hypothetical protein